jgi:hypothetical protein
LWTSTLLQVDLFASYLRKFNLVVTIPEVFQSGLQRWLKLLLLPYFLVLKLRHQFMVMVKMAHFPLMSGLPDLKLSFAASLTAAMF